MEILHSIDKVVFYFLNHAFANPFFDWFMPFITEEDHWRIPILLAVGALLGFGRRKGRMTVLLIVLIIALSDQLVNFVIKPLVGRMRPCFVLENVRCLIDQPRSKSFPSSHAANMAAMAVLFSVRYRKYAAVFVSIAVLVSYSRIYVGVHYPSDILGGWAVGALCALGVFAVKRQIGHVLSKRREIHENAIRKNGRRTDRW